MRILGIAALDAALGGCASSSADIAPAYVSPVAYQSYTCQQLAIEAQSISTRAATLSGAQDSQRTKDGWAIAAAVVVFWPAAFFVGGDKQTAAELSQMKGQMVAVEQASIAKKCTTYAFTLAPKSMSNMTMLKHLKEITGDETLTVHGFRTTFRTWAQEETDFEEEIVEHCLHHITGDDAEKAYKRGEALRKRRTVMQAFANCVTRPPKDNVTPMRAA
jgi:hypothetical protein